MSTSNNVHVIRIVVIDLQEYWRMFAEDVLRSAGYHVRILGNYRDAYRLLEDTDISRRDLVILGCVSIDAMDVEERLLLAHILKHNHHLLVFSTQLPADVMRTLFLNGVEDALEKVYDARSLASIVAQTLKRITAERTSFHFPTARGV